LVGSLSDLTAVAKAILGIKTSSNVYCLMGELGAGKTTLVKAFAELLLVDDEVTSPSYSLINEYGSEDTLIYHVDLYRLNSLDEAINIGIEDYIHSGKLMFVEWPDLIIPLLDDFNTIKINVENESMRKILFLYDP